MDESRVTAAGLRRFFGVAHIRWELPFPLRLRAEGIFCWEPQEGIALLVPVAQVGSVQWRRSSPLLSAQEIFADSTDAEPANALPQHNYLLTAWIDGVEYRTTQLHSGPNGGFDEVHGYTVANLYVGLRKADEFDIDKLAGRALDALNNVIGIHSIIALDGYTRSLRSELDHYYTVFSLAKVPKDWEQMTSKQLVSRVRELEFSAKMGNDRMHKIGIGTADDLTIRPFQGKAASAMADSVREHIGLALHQQLFLSAVRNLTRQDSVLAIIDAESAVEVCLANLVRQGLLAGGQSEADVESAFGGRLHGVQAQVVQLDRLASARDSTAPRFEHSASHRGWITKLANIRHAVVHRGQRDVSWDVAKEGLSAGLEAILMLETALPQFAPRITWQPEFAKLDRVKKTARKLVRLFET